MCNMWDVLTIYNILKLFDGVTYRNECTYVNIANQSFNEKIECFGEVNLVNYGRSIAADVGLVLKDILSRLQSLNCFCS